MTSIHTTEGTDLEEVFTDLASSSCEGIFGVRRYDGAEPGPVVGITVCTHGNEPSGLAATLEVDQMLSSKPFRGTVYVVLNNIEAARKFFFSRTDEERRQARYKDINMNRLPSDTMERAGDKRYEIQRARELNSLWKQFQYGMDIHSTTLPSEPMIIGRDRSIDSVAPLIAGFPIKMLISNIANIQIGKPAFAFYGSNLPESLAFSIEAGQHTDALAMKRAVDCTRLFLENTGVLEREQETEDSIERDEYEIDGAILFPDVSYDLVQDFKTYDRIAEGELLARNLNGNEIRAPFEGHLIFPTSYRGEEKDISEEMSFISRPVKHLTPQ